MKAMILAAGRGERMMPLTADTPKPMLAVNGKPLLQYHIENLKQAGFTEIVINHAWCGEKIVEYFGNGESFGVNITYSDESSGALETAGGIIKALPLLVEQPEECFLVVNGDVFCPFDYQTLAVLPKQLEACLYLVDNPEHNKKGDFELQPQNEYSLVTNKTLTNKTATNKTQAQSHLTNTTYTFSGIAVYRASFFSNYINGESLTDTRNILPLGGLLREAAQQQLLQGIKLTSPWVDVGTPARLLTLNNELITRENKLLRN